MFITFEGPDGSGKSTQARRAVEYLRQAGTPVYGTREPGGTPIGDQVRAILSDLNNSEMVPRAEILLFQASRAQLVAEVIRPHLALGEVVICDRYADSTLAYQGYGHQMELAELRRVVAFATGGLKPDLTLLLDIDAELGLMRRAKGGDWNRLDAYDLPFHERVRCGYLEMARAEPERWVLIDAAGSSEQVQQAVREVILTRLAAYQAAGMKYVA